MGTIGASRGTQPEFLTISGRFLCHVGPRWEPQAPPFWTSFAIMGELFGIQVWSTVFGPAKVLKRRASDPQKLGFGVGVLEKIRKSWGIEKSDENDSESAPFR